MEILKMIVTGIASAVPFLASTITFIVKFIQNRNAKVTLGESIKIAEAMQVYVEKAEAFLHYTGEEKKQYVITFANQFAIDNGMKFDKEKILI